MPTTVAALALVLSLGGCGINAQKAVDDIFNVKTSTAPFANARTTPTEPATTTPAGPATTPATTTPAAPEPAPLPTPAPPVTEPVAVAIPVGVAAAVAARTASAYVKVRGGLVNPSDWEVSCSGDEAGSRWNCSLSSGGCAGNVVVARTPPSNAVQGRPQSIACG